MATHEKDASTATTGLSNPIRVAVTVTSSLIVGSGAAGITWFTFQHFTEAYLGPFLNKVAIVGAGVLGAAATGAITYFATGRCGKSTNTENVYREDSRLIN